MPNSAFRIPHLSRSSSPIATEQGDGFFRVGDGLRIETAEMVEFLGRRLARTDEQEADDRPFDRRRLVPLLPIKPGDAVERLPILPAGQIDDGRGRELRPVEQSP